MDRMDTVFIKTSDEETKEKLEVENFELIDFSNGIWTFLNEPKKSMSFNKNNDLDKVVFSNKLCI